MRSTRSSKPKKILSEASAGATIVGGGNRLSREEEIALNVLLRRAGGEESGAALFRISWALEDNHSKWDGARGEYVYDPTVRTPICFHPCQASYHLTAWEPPSEAHRELVSTGQIRGEGSEKGVYNCLFHLVDPKTNEPFLPSEIRTQLIEIVIPVMKQIGEIGRASRLGYQASAAALRAKRVEQLKEVQAKKDRDYVEFADRRLEEGMPIMHDGNVPGEVDRSVDPEQPSEFAFSVRARERKP